MNNQKSRRIRIWTLALALIVASGCSASGKIRQGPYWLTRAGVHVFDTGPSHKEFVGLCVFAPIYFPLMAVLDTAVLPFTWPFLLTPQWQSPKTPSTTPTYDRRSNYAAWSGERHTEPSRRAAVERECCCYDCRP